MWITVNPHLLFSTCDTDLLYHAAQSLSFRPQQIADTVMRNLYKRRRFPLKSVQSSLRALVVGVANTAGEHICTDSPGLAIMRALRDNWEVKVQWVDPLVGQGGLPEFEKLERGGWCVEVLWGFDAIIVTTEQLGVDLGMLEGLDGVVVHFCC